MADPTPPSDIPDPASPTPVSPAPRTVPAATTGPKRIRSMPDRPAGTRPAGTIRSVPTTTSASARPPGTYAASFGNEKSWARGLGILWTLFLLTMLLEGLNAAFYLLAGKISWPPMSHVMIGSMDQILPVETARLVLVCTLFIGLWVGWGWLRYVLATIDFLSGLWLVVGMIASYHAAPKFKATGIADVPVYTSIESMPKIALGILYLLTAAYVILSHDVLEFVAHRRTNGRVWSAILVTIISYGCMVLILGAQPFYNLWLNTQRPAAMAFGEDTLRTISQSWAGDSIDSRLDPEFAKSFTPNDRKATFAGFKPLGPLQSANTAPPLVVTTVQPNPLQNIVPAPADLATQVTPDGYSFQVNARYNTTGATFEHGNVRFGFDLVRDLVGAWRIRGLDARDVKIDYPHPPAPPATPAPDGVPGTTAPSPTPTATASTLPTDAAAPAPSPTPAPTTPVAPPPAASATPAASPVPSTGG